MNKTPFVTREQIEEIVKGAQGECQGRAGSLFLE